VKQNPFERYDLDPREGVSAITQKLKELAEDATDDAERERIRAAWEELTLHPQRRLRAALDAHPETRPPLGSPPLAPRPLDDGAARPSGGRTAELGLRDLAAWPSVRAVLPAPCASPSAQALGEVAPSLDDDPHF